MICQSGILYYKDECETLIDHTVVFDFERENLVMPRKPVSLPGISAWGIVDVVLVGAAIVIIFWLPSSFLKADKRLMHPINTVSLILGVSILVQPERLVETITLIFLVMASTRYTAIFYTELCNFGIVEEGNLDITSLGELDQSGLCILIDEYYYDLVIEDMQETLKRRTHNVPHLTIPMELLRRNLTTFMRKQTAELIVGMRKSGNKGLLKLTDFCIFTSLNVYLLYRLSIYRDRINDILLRVLESGMRQK